MSETVRRIRPTPTDAYLANPHRGCCTFQRFNGDELYPDVRWSEEGPVTFPEGVNRTIAGYLPTTVSYCRWFWPVLEPKRGEYDFSVVDRSIEVCRKRGQTLAVRLMAFGSRMQPQVPTWYSDSFAMSDWTDWSGFVQRVPAHDSPEYFKHWGDLIKEFGRRYDGNPTLETIDVSFIGPWGEGAGECSVEQCVRFAELWKNAFPKTPRLSLVADEQLKIGLARGAGWRCDCFGDLTAVGDAEIPAHLAWNHTFDAYPSFLADPAVRDAWRTAPVHLETCAVPLAWQRQNYDLDLILQQGLKYHATYFMPKSTPIPQDWMGKIATFCNALGYRYILRQALFDTTMTRSKKFIFKSWIENVGVAPIYRKYDLALRFRQGDIQKIVVLPDVDVLDWLPGDAYINVAIDVPAELKTGPVDLSLGLIDPVTQEARIQFAIKETYPDRWAPIDQIYMSAV